MPLNRSSKEDSVTKLERRVEIIQLELPFATSVRGRKIVEVATKGIPITKKMVWVWEWYKKLKSNKGNGRVDGVNLESYSENPSRNLYKLWNRLTSGSYYPKAVMEVEISKRDGSKRKLGIPTIDDRIAQQVIKDYLENGFEKVFHDLILRISYTSKRRPRDTRSRRKCMSESMAYRYGHQKFL